MSNQELSRTFYEQYGDLVVRFPEKVTPNPAERAAIVRLLEPIGYVGPYISRERELRVSSPILLSSGAVEALNQQIYLILAPRHTTVRAPRDRSS